jgi:hypothetical protein
VAMSERSTISSRRSNGSVHSVAAGGASMVVQLFSLGLLQLRLHAAIAGTDAHCCRAGERRITIWDAGGRFGAEADLQF